MSSDAEKKVLFSAIQPSGTITLGNYLGALKNWVDMQDDYNCIFALADLHAITVRQEPKNLRKNTIEAYALLLACGINVEKSLFFIQSQVSTHAQLAWILNCYTQFGELSRMTQFKDKSKQHAQNINCGLFTYPSLMAADILLYSADLVPVGADQKQHLELTRDIAERFNSIYTPTFVVPQPYICKAGAKIMSLQDPSKKMSKSDANENAWVGVLDSQDVIMRKFKRAVTDSETEVCFRNGKDGINNLLTIYSCMSGKTIEEAQGEFKGVGYGEFKEAVGEAVVKHLAPIQERFAEIIKNREYMESLYRKSAQEAYGISNKVLSKVKRKVGFIA